MSIDGKFDLMHYAKHQRKYFFHKYERYQIDKGKNVSIEWYMKKIYIPMGYAKQFHIDYMKEYNINTDEL